MGLARSRVHHQGFPLAPTLQQSQAAKELGTMHQGPGWGGGSGLVEARPGRQVPSLSLAGELGHADPSPGEATLTALGLTVTSVSPAALTGKFPCLLEKVSGSFWLGLRCSRSNHPPPCRLNIKGRRHGRPSLHQAWDEIQLSLLLGFVGDPLSHQFKSCSCVPHYLPPVLAPDTGEIRTSERPRRVRVSRVMARPRTQLSARTGEA